MKAPIQCLHRREPNRPQALSAFEMSPVVAHKKQYPIINPIGYCFQSEPVLGLRKTSAGFSEAMTERDEIGDSGTQMQATRAIARAPRMGLNVYDALLGDIMTLKIPPGGRISVDALVRDLGVSQTPVREALTRLEAEGLVVKTHLVGYSAASLLDRKHFEDICDLRLALEPIAARRAAESGNAEAIGLIVARNDQIPSAVAQGRSYSQFAKGDAEFHDAILAAGANALMGETLARLRVHFHLFRLYFHHRVTKEAVDEHAVIVNCLQAGDGKGAERAMRKHLQRSRERFRVFFED